MLFPLVLALAALAWRVAKLKFGMSDVLPNFSPWLALAFAGAAVMPRSAPFWLWPALLLGVDALCHPQDIAGMWLVYACLGGAALWGSSVRGRATVVRVLGGTLIGSVGFYLITNTQAWLMNPVYAKSAAGWLQALTTGDPAYAPTWLFGLRSLLSDMGFASLLVLAFNVEARARETAAMPVAA